jgi:flagellar FliL protein
MAAAPQKVKNDAGNAEADAGDKKRKKLILIAGLAVALIAISVGGTVIALKMLSPAPASIDEKTEAVEETNLAPAIYFDMAPNFTINFNVNGRQRYLQAAITLLHRDPALNELLKLHMPAIRNGLVMLLSSKNFEELQTNEGKEKLKTEALEIINNQLKKEQEALVDPSEEDEDKKPVSIVEQVLFTNFVMQ